MLLKDRSSDQGVNIRHGQHRQFLTRIPNALIRLPIAVQKSSTCGVDHLDGIHHLIQQGPKEFKFILGLLALGDVGMGA